MPAWDATMWVTAIATAAAVVGLVVATLAWLRPRSPRAEEHVLPHQRLRVTVSNHFPVFDQVDGSKKLGDHLIAFTVHSGTSRQVKATGWGVHLPGNKNLVAMVPTTHWEPSLPHWIEPGDEATWYLTADDVRRQAEESKCKFGDIRGYVSFADGREISASDGLPLS
jgi:hypothetical protein